MREVYVCFCGQERDPRALLCQSCIDKEAKFASLVDKLNKHLDKEENMAEEKKEQVNHPKHYNHGKYEVIDVIEDWEVDFHIGNVIKYVSRAGRKTDDTEIQDLKKALWYLQRKIDTLEKK